MIGVATTAMISTDKISMLRHSKTSEYQRLKESTSLLELALWKARTSRLGRWQGNGWRS
jgi:hypothetical protein